jgi:hypothetical protein
VLLVARVEGNEDDDTASAVEVVVTFSFELLLMLLLMPLPELLEQLLSQLLFVIEGRALVEVIDVDISSRI